MVRNVFPIGTATDTSQSKPYGKYRVGYGRQPGEELRVESHAEINGLLQDDGSLFLRLQPWQAVSPAYIVTTATLAKDKSSIWSFAIKSVDISS